MKKIQAALLLVAALTLLTLSGCDKILESFYPEFAQKANAISIWAEFKMYPSQIYGSNPYIAGRIYETADPLTIVRENFNQPIYDWIEDKTGLGYYSVNANLDFNDIADGDYRVLVWLEQNGDGLPYGVNEPSANATNLANSSETFSFPNAFGSEDWLYGEVSEPLH